MRGEATAASDAKATIRHSVNGGVKGRVSIFEAAAAAPTVSDPMAIDLSEMSRGARSASTDALAGARDHSVDAALGLTNETRSVRSASNDSAYSPRGRTRMQSTSL